MKTQDEIKQYAKDTYKRTFTTKKVIRDAKGKIARTEVSEVDPIVVDCDSHWAVYAHVDASPIILSKNV